MHPEFLEQLRRPHPKDAEQDAEQIAASQRHLVDAKVAL